jgi:hypothetical protein
VAAERCGAAFFTVAFFTAAAFFVAVFVAAVFLGAVFLGAAAFFGVDVVVLFVLVLMVPRARRGCLPDLVGRWLVNAVHPILNNSTIFERKGQY